MTILEELVLKLKDTNSQEIHLQTNGIIRGFNEDGWTVHGSFKEDPQSLIEKCQIECIKMNLRLDPVSPECSGTLMSHGIRFYIAIPPLVRGYPMIAIRKQQLDQIRLEDFDIEARDLKHLILSLQSYSNFFIFGPTGSGKTSFMTSLLKKVPVNEKVLIIEDQDEIPIHEPHWDKFYVTRADQDHEGEVDWMMALKASLRVRPNRIVLAELRLKDMEILEKAIHLGFQSVFATFHANSLEDARCQLEKVGIDAHSSIIMVGMRPRVNLKPSIYIPNLID